MPHHLGNIDASAPSAVITGDPDRVPLLSSPWGGARRTWRQRGFVCALTANEPLFVCSTGIGGPTTAIVVEELAQLGVGSFVRVGTCGSMQRRVRPGDLVISSATVRDDGTSDAYLPVEMPAVADTGLLRALVREAAEEGVPSHVGVTHCKDAYYAESPSRLPLESYWRDRWAMLKRLGVLATEMEIAALYAVAQSRGLRAGAVVVPVDDTLPPDRKDGSLIAAARVAGRALLSAPSAR